jgi:probable F420-dependent oxidoreductase
VKFGFFVYLQCDPKRLLKNARTAEDLGFESFWMGEHIGVPFKINSHLPDYEGDSLPLTADSKFPDPLLALTYVAAHTNRIKLGTLIYVLPIRDPFAVAKAVATIDQYSNGRFLFGVGIGWLKEEFDWIGSTWEDRALRTNEYIKLMTEFWSSSNPVFKGKTIQTQGVNMEPKTVQQPRPPVIIAGTAHAALRRAARIGDGWHGLVSDFKRLSQLLKELHEAEHAYSRTTPLEISVNFPLTGLDDVKRLADMGVDRVVTQASLEGGTDDSDYMRHFQNQFMTKE